MAVLLDRQIVSPEECRKRLAADPDSGFSDIDADDLPEPPEDGELGAEAMAGFAGGEVDGPERPAMARADVDDVDKAGALDTALTPAGQVDLKALARRVLKRCKAGAVYGSDESLWRTSKRGKPFEIDTETGEITKGNIGQADGPAIERQKAIQAKIDSIRIEPGKDNVLPNLNEDTLEEYGFKDKKIILKGNILQRNLNKHNDISIDESKELIGQALYNHVDVIGSAYADKPYMNFIGIDKSKHCVVLVDVEETRDSYEIVHWYRLKLGGVNRLKRKAEGVGEKDEK